MALTKTGKFVQSSMSGGFPSAVPDNEDFFNSGASADAYPTDKTDNNYNDFGFQANTVVITNESANDLVYQWLNRAGTSPDSGVVKANATIVLRNARKKGILFRSRNSGAAANWILTAI